jgi:alpha-tubulin suppressor-like RCC1 family protein
VGLFHKCARLADGEVRCWGERAPGPGGGWAESATPVPVPGAGPAADVAVGTGHACALRRDGHIVCWGENVDAQLGDGRPIVRPVPTRVEGVRDVAALAADALRTCALGRDGRARCWGDATCADPQPVELPAANLKDLAAANTVACGLGRDGRLTCRRWERGAGWRDEALPPDLGRLDAFALADDHACGLRGGRVRCWGKNEQGQVGAGAPDEETAVAAGPPGGVAALSAGEYHTCARLAGGEVWCWGTLTGFRAQPLRRIEGISTAAEITSGADHACARLNDGDVVCFGEMGYGDQFLSSEKPKKIDGLRGIEGLRSGTHVTCGLRAGQAVCWGENGVGQLGDGTRADRPDPVTVKLPARAAGLAVGFRHACAVDAEGAVWCWGQDSHGQLGDGRVSWCARPSDVALPEADLTPVTPLVPCPAGRALTWQAHVEWLDPATGKLRARDLKWTGRFLQCTAGPDGTTALVEGLPLDLAWYRPGKKPGLYAVHEDARGLFIRQIVTKALHGGPPYDFREPEPGDQLARFPLAEGDCVGGEPGRTDGMYCWKAAKLEGDGWQFSQDTLPDRSVLRFVPGVGLTDFEYAHHGTAASVKARLVPGR